MRAGIIGARNAGKSTVFRALTGLAPLEGQADAKNRARPGQIKVPDPRLDFLEEAYGSKKKVQVELTVLDFAPNPKEQKAGAAIDPTMIPLIRDLDAILLVVPDYSGNNPDPAQTLASLESELVFADFEQAERRVERLKKEKSPSDLERTALDKCLKQLEGGAPVRTLALTPQEVQRLSNFAFLSQKPAIAVINCDTEQASGAIAPELQSQLAARGVDGLKLAAAFEAELWELPDDARCELLREAGIEAPARDRLISALYRDLGLITFYTAGEPEARAWPLRIGSSALDAAGKIHTDIARGFIRAEVVSYADFAELRSDAKVKAAGKLRLEGKEYTMRDGDIIHIRFKV